MSLLSIMRMRSMASTLLPGLNLESNLYAWHGRGYMVVQNDMAAFSPSLLLFLGLVSTVRGYLHIYPPFDENDTRTPLYFALLQSFGSEYNGSGSVAGLQVALDRINNDSTLLPGYSLHYTLTDSQVKLEHSLFIYTVFKACSGVNC